MHDPEYLESTEHAIGMLYLSRTLAPEHADGWVHEVFIDGHLLMSSVSPKSEEELASQALAAHRGDGPLRVLVGGLGLGYTAAKALQNPRAIQVDVIEKMDFVINWLKRDRLPLSAALTTDPRLEFVLDDVYAMLLGEPKQTYDVLLVDVDHAPHWPLHADSLPFYTVAGQRAVAAHVAPGGIVAVWSAHDSEDFAIVMAESYPEAWRTTVVWDSPCEGGGSDRLVNTLFFGRVPLF